MTDEVLDYDSTESQPKGPRAIVRVVGPVIGPAPLQTFLQKLADEGIYPGDYQVLIVGSATPKTKAGLIKAAGDGESAQVETLPAFIVIYAVTSCEHQLDPVLCKDCRPAKPAAH
ncbi:MAG: hypothetical protein OES13_00260 [Acidimicrobiia bacterium]|nr:hypothetical protein [Acidimicrobiia bacterium]